MTDEEFLAEEAKGNYKRIGVIDGADQHGTELRILCDEWEPVIGDMFSVRGFIAREDSITGRTFDVQFVTSRVLSEEGRRRTLEINPGIWPSGPYRNVLRLATDGAILYRPSGRLLNAIWDAWPATSH